MRFAPPSTEHVPREGGWLVLRSRFSAPEARRCLGDCLVEWADRAPERTLDHALCTLGAMTLQGAPSTLKRRRPCYEAAR